VVLGALGQRDPEMTAERGGEISPAECAADRRRAAWIGVWSVIIAIVAAMLTVLIPR
jgi:hypothetical protein